MALIGASLGGHAVLLAGAGDARIRALVVLSPLVEPRAAELPGDLANQSATLLNGVTGAELLRQWNALQPVSDCLRSLAARALLLVSGDQDELFPPSHYADFVSALPDVRWARAPEGDHAFSTCRPWLVRTVTEWLVARCGA